MFLKHLNMWIFLTFRKHSDITFLNTNVNTYKTYFCLLGLRFSMFFVSFLRYEDGQVGDANINTQDVRIQKEILRVIGGQSTWLTRFTTVTLWETLQGNISTEYGKELPQTRCFWWRSSQVCLYMERTETPFVTFLIKHFLEF